MQRWRKEVGEKESIRKPLAAGVKVRCLEFTSKATEKKHRAEAKLHKDAFNSIAVLLLLCRKCDLVLICRHEKQTKTNKPARRRR